MRICMVTSAAFPPREGVGHYVWNLSRYIVEQGHAASIITRGQPGRLSHSRIADVSIWRAPFYPIYPLHVHLHSLFAQRLAKRLKAEVDVFHFHTPLPALIRSDCPHVVTVHTPMLAEAQAVRIKDLLSLAIKLQIPVSVWLERRILAGAARVSAVSQSVADELDDYGLSRDHIQVLGNGVDTDLFCPGDGGQSNQDSRPYVLAAGRLDARKGLDDLIEAMQYVIVQHPTVGLLIAGEGPLEGRWKAKARVLGLADRIRFLGQVTDRDEMIELYRNATVFAHAAHYEGLPTVLLEAMACGKPVVSTAVSGALDVITDAVDGLLVPVRAPVPLAEAICRLLGDADLCDRLGMAARRAVEARYSWQVVGSNYLQCYRDLLDGVSP